MIFDTNKSYIEALIQEGEHQRQDFKFEISDSRKIAKTISAFSNTAGGKLLIGVKDNGKLTGVQSKEEAYMLEAAAELYCSPPISIEIETYKIDGKEILVVLVPESQTKPIYALTQAGEKLAYLRINDETLLASILHLETWRQSYSLKDEFITYTEEESKLIKLITEQAPLTLNQLNKQTSIQRKELIHLIGRLVRYNIIKICHDKERFVIYPTE